MPQPGKSRREATREAVRRTSRVADPREAARSAGSAAQRHSGSADPFTSGLRRREVLPLLVLHYIGEGPSYGNQLMERISNVTAGVLSVNPNTMYPLLRSLEAQGLLAGRWEDPERRSRRFYRATSAGRAEGRRLAAELAPRLERIARAIRALEVEVLGAG